MNEPLKDSHCSYCGSKFTEQNDWPRRCFVCWNISYKNPTPVVVMIVPVRLTEQIGTGWGWLIEQRNIEPEKGGWAMPSGYVEFGETWQQAAVRELREEVGLATNPEDFEIFDIVNSTYGNMLIFCRHKGVNEEDILFVPNEEVSAIKIEHAPKALCFPTHNQILERLYHGK